jgi:hypothetical protein
MWQELVKFMSSNQDNKMNVKIKKLQDMKKAIQIIVLLLVVLVPVILTAQPHPYDPALGGGTGGTPAGGGAPIGGGLLILLSLAIGYGTKKIYEARKKVLN